MSFATWLLSVRQDRSRRYHKTTRRNTLLTAIRRMFFEPLEERVVLAVTFSGTTLPNDCGFWTCVATGDFNSDGNPDVVFSQGTSTQVKVFSGNGNGAFPTTTTFGFPTSLFPIANTTGLSVAAGDFNGDGKADVAITDNRNGLDVALGDGSGNFVAGSASRFVIPGVGDYLGRALAFDMDVADVNGDGKPDLVTTNVGPRKVSVFLNTTTTGAGTATFSPSVEFSVGSGAYELQLADLNGDGKPDIITANARGNSVSVLLNTTAINATTASFSGRVDIAVGAYPEQVTVGDFDGDGKPDLATANANAGTVSVLRNTIATGAGTATFAPKVDIFTGGFNWAIANADFNGDGKLDLAVPGKMLLGNGNGSFAPFVSTAGAYTRGFVVGDWNRDGKPDLAHSGGVLINGTTAVFPTLVAPTATSITGSAAILGGNVTSIGSAAITQRGILYSRTSVNPNPTLGGADVTQVNDGASTLGVFTDAVSGLQAGTSYSYVAFASNSLGTAYTAVSMFSTLSSTLPAVTTQPNSQTVNALSSVSFTAAASGSPAPTLQWVVSTDNGTTFNPISGATFTTLSFVTTGNMSGNQYKAIFTNVAGSVTTNPATLMVNKLHATILVSGYNGVYDGGAHGATGTATGLGGVDLSASLNFGASYTNVPGGNAHWVFTGGTNYLNDEGNTAIAVTKAPTTTNITIVGAPFTYNGSAQTPATVAVTGVGGLSLTPTASYANNTNAGTATATASYSYAESANYLASSDSKDFAIAKASSTTVVTIAAGTFTYNGSAQTPATVTVTGAGGLSLTPTASYANNTNAGTATASYSYAESANYLASSDSKDFAIAKASSTTVVTIAAGTFTYNGSAQTPATVTVTGAGGLSLTPTASYANNTNAGTATASYSYAESANYLASSDSKDFAIAKASSTTVVTITAGTFTYNGSAQTPATVTVTGAGGLSLTPTASYANNTNAGTATASYSYAESANYLGSSDSKDFAIAKASSTTLVTIAAGTFTYNGSAQTPATVTVTGVGGLSLTPTASYANNTNAGTATASYSYAASDNYLASSDSKNFNIAKATATVIVTPYTVTYDGSSHTATVTSISGVNGESNATVGTVDVSNTTHTAAGIYSSDSWSFTGAANYNNIASTTITDTINPAYVSGGFLAPISQNRAFKAGSTVALKFQVKDGSGNVITTTSAVTAVKVQLLDGSGNPGSPTYLYQNGTSSYATGGTVFRYDSAGQQFMFNWNTKTFAIGSYKLTTTLVDGSSFTQTIMLSTSGNAAALVINGVTGQPAVGALLAGDVSLFVDNSNGAFSGDELARIQETVSGIQALVSAYGSNIVIVDASIGLSANIVLNSRSTSVLGGMVNGVLGVTTSAGEITIIDGWNWYAGANVNSIGSGQYDFQTVITHEIGHSVGLGHGTVITSVMYPALSTAAARRTMLLADLHTPGEGNNGSGLHAEAIFASTVTPAAPPVALPTPVAHLSNSRTDRVDGADSIRVPGYQRNLSLAFAANHSAVDSAIAGWLMELTPTGKRWSSDLPTNSKPTSNDLLDALDVSFAQEFGRI